jgi:type I restriction enzyme M protein
VLANGPLSSNQAGEGAIRQRLVEEDVIDCIVYLPSQLFYSTQIAASLWFVTRSKRPRSGKNGVRYGDRTGRTLFIDARHHGVMVDRTHRELTDNDIDDIAWSYRRWRAQDGTYHDVPGFCREAMIDDIRAHRHALVPGRYVGFEHRPATNPSDRNKFLADLEEIEEQVEQVGSLARTAIATLREVLHG